MPLSDHVQLTISQDSVGIARAGFGVPLILSHTADWVERVREYASAAEVAVDFATDSPEYLQASALFAQSPHPTKCKIARATLHPTMKYTIGMFAAHHSHTYQLTVSGPDMDETVVEYESDSATTAAEIHNGLVTALNAVTGNNYIAAFAALVNPDDVFTATHGTETFTAATHGLLTGDGPFQVSSDGTLPDGLTAVTDYWIIRVDANDFKLASSLANALAGTAVAIADNGTGTHTIADTASTKRPSDDFTVTGDAAGDWFSIEVMDRGDLYCKMSHADPGVATDLAAIVLIDNDWYELLTMYNSQAYVTAAAAWVESNKKRYRPQTSDTKAMTATVGSATDTADALHTLEYSRTSVWFHPSPAAFLDAGVSGRVLPIEPGGQTDKFKKLNGIAAVTMTSTERTNLVNKKANSYQSVAGRSITFEGTAADGQFFDTIRDIDWLEDDMTKGVFGALAGANKIPYTDQGVAIVTAQVRASLQRAVNKGILSNSPSPVVTAPLVADIDTTNKALRLLPDVKWSATLAGAIHKVIITGVVSV